MTQLDTLLYFEDDFLIAECAVKRLQKEFPKYRCISHRGHGEWEDEVLENLNGMERIAIILTDGQLADTYGWEVIERFRQLGYTGPTVYTGLSRLPEDKKHLYSERAEKTGQGLIEVVEKHISH